MPAGIGRIARLAMLAAALPLLVAARYYVLPAADLLLPDASGHRPGEVFAAKAGDTVLLNPLAMAERVRLAEPVRVETPGLAKAFAAGDRLMRVEIWATGRLTAHLPRQTAYYCDPSERPRSYSIWESPSVIQTGLCFYDRDRDQVLDGAFWGNARRPADQVMVPISPIRIEVERNVAAGDTSHLKLVFAGADRADGNLRFDLVYMSCGHPINITSFSGTPARTVISPRRGLPRSLRFGDAAVTVLAYDSAGGVAQLRIDGTLTPGPVARNQTSLPPAVCY